MQQPKNLGKGAAVKRGVLESTGDLVLFMDADHATPIEEMELVLPHLESGTYRAVVGVRTYQHDDSKWRRIMGLSLQILTHLIVFDRAVVDSQCGFKCFGSDVAKRIFGLTRIKGGMFDVEIFVIMHRLGVNVLYQPVHWTNKAGSRINFIRCMLMDPVDMCDHSHELHAGALFGAPAERGDRTDQGVSVRARSRLTVTGVPGWLTYAFLKSLRESPLGGDDAATALVHRAVIGRRPPARGVPERDGMAPVRSRSAGRRAPAARGC